MSEVDFVNIAAASIATPASGRSALFVENVSKRLCIKRDDGTIDILDDVMEASVAAQGAGFAADTYLTGSGILLPRAPSAKTLYQCSFDVSKTAAGAATPIIIVRFGTAGALSDAARLTFTFPAGTAAADVGMFTVWALFRTIGAAGVLQGRAGLVHTGGATGLTGLSVNPGPTLQVTSGGFDTTVASSIIGLSVNGGASAAWTVQLVEAMLSPI